MWAEPGKLTWVNITSGLNQIPLLQIEDMSTDTMSSDVIIYQPGPVTLNVRDIPAPCEVNRMLWPQHMWCEMVSFSTSKPSVS